MNPKNLKMALNSFKLCIIFLLFFSCQTKKNDKPNNEKDLILFEKKIKNSTDLSLDSLIKLAKEIENDLPLNCEVDSKIVIRPTTVCYLNDEIKKITETRNLNYLSYDSISKAKIVTHRIIYLINNEYSLVLHPNFDSPLAINDKWNWSKVIIKNNEVIKYKTQDFKNHKGIFLNKKSLQFTNAQKYYPIKIEHLLNNYKKQSK